MKERLLAVPCWATSMQSTDALSKLRGVVKHRTEAPKIVQRKLGKLSAGFRFVPDESKATKRPLLLIERHWLGLPQSLSEPPLASETRDRYDVGVYFSLETPHLLSR